VWWTKASLRMAFFACFATLGKIFNMDNLWKQLVIVVNRCCMCKRNGEFVDHLLFLLLLHCDVVYVMWNIFFGQFELSWVMSRQVVNLYACWWIVSNTRSNVFWQ
jgi:hypothetical protein